MKLASADPKFLTVLLVIVVLLTLALMAIALFLLLRSRSKADPEAATKDEDSDGGKPKGWMPLRTKGMAANFREAMQRLRERLPGWNARYGVPWYVLVGEEGSGKTTIANTLGGIGAEVVQDNEDYSPRWLLLDQAVLIDIPGRAFLASQRPAPGADKQETHKLLRGADDRTAWHSFLRLATHHRPRQPLNGIVLTISATELLQAAADPERPERMARIAELARRLDDVQHFTGLKLPVYVLVTRCDAVSGFTSYSRMFFEQAAFRAAGRNGSGELEDGLFGWSNPHLLDKAFSASWVDEAFDDVNDVLLRYQLEMLAESRTTAAADDVLLFPFEVQSLRGPLRSVLDRVFRTTAYHGPHLLRGIYFCGRENPGEQQPVASNAIATLATPPALLHAQPGRLLYIRDLFQFKIFAEKYLATALAGGFFTRNRSVRAAQTTAVILAVLLTAATFGAWARISRLQRDHIDPVLQSMSTDLDAIAVSSGSNLAPAVDIFSTVGASRANQFYAIAMPYSFVDIEGLHRRLSDVLSGSFAVVVLRSCKDALDRRMLELMRSAPPTAAAPNALGLSYPPGNGWTDDPAYRSLEKYLADLQALHTNIDRYRFISGAGSGSFVQLNSLLRYLGGFDLPDSSRFASNSAYQQLLLNATWQPLAVPANYDEVTATVARTRINAFYQSWFDANPLVAEIRWLRGESGWSTLLSGHSSLSNDQLRAIVNHIQAMDAQLSGGSWDWLTEGFNRENYPALGSELDAMPFAGSTYTDAVSALGAQKLAALKTAVSGIPAVVTTEDDEVRLDDDVRTLGSVLSSLLGYEVMDDTQESSAADGGCRLMPTTYVWNQSDLQKAISLFTMRSKIENELLPDLPGEYRQSVQALVDTRAAANIANVLAAAYARNPNAGDAQAELDTDLQNFNQSLDALKQVKTDLSSLHATATESCLNRSLNRQANALLVRINSELPSLYSPDATASSGTAQPVSLYLYGLNSSEDLQAYLAAEKQKITSLAAEAAPLVQWLHSQGGHSAVLTKWRYIAQDVDALSAGKPGNPIQTLETYISTELDKVTPEAACRTIGHRNSADVFLNVRAQLAAAAVDYCHQVAIARFNAIAADFNRRLAGHFPFSQFLDTRPGSEATISDITAFYRTVDQDVAGLSQVLPPLAGNPAEVSAFLRGIQAARPLVTGTAKNPAPALGTAVQFRANRNHENFGNRIAEWTLRIGQQTLTYPPAPGDGPPLVWNLGDPVTLTLRYANNSPEVPTAANPSAAAHISGDQVTYRYGDSWSLFALLRDHPPNAADPANAYAFTIPNHYVQGAATAGQPADTLVYLQVDLLPAGAKPGGDVLPFAGFPSQAPMVTLKPSHAIMTETNDGPHARSAAD